MFGIGGSEILVILVVALLFLGPEKLPDAAKQISKGIRDLRKQTRALQQTIEDDEHIGGAIRDLKSALRGEDVPVRSHVPISPPSSEEVAASDVTTDALSHEDEDHAAMYELADEDAEHAAIHALDNGDAEAPHVVDGAEHPAAQPKLVGEANAVTTESDSELALIKPPKGETAAREVPEQHLDATARKHG